MALKVAVFLSCVLGMSTLTLEEPEDGGKHWVVIVAGSNGWYNYRHQADACHAYQIVHQNGIPDEQIVVMMYDDIAYSDDNPTKGIIINRPNGTDVYKGVLKDYTNKDVTPDTFLAVLRGDAEAVKNKGSGKVLQSGPKDHVFVYFTDHGGPGILAFPDDDLKVQHLNKTIRYMYHHKKYQKMVFYIEACESGSMMENLPDDINGRFEKRNPPQAVCVSKEAHQHQSCDASISHMKVMQFQGSKRNSSTPISLPPVDHYDLTPSPDVPLAIMKRKLMATNDFYEAKAIVKEMKAHLEARQLIQESMHKIMFVITGSKEHANKILSSRLSLRNYDCYESAMDHFKKHCFNWHNPLYEYALRQLYALVNVCETGYPVDRIQLAMDEVCLG
ncbi:Legumain [Ophiophagus hannah]|uniref:Legumain n=1 Tax=Ophiophagus hannah TaxID=8665 RepID=V8P8K1_OPHHA|nr:Legumain [Ophiophagus hannah]